MCANPYLQLREYGFSLARAGYFWVFSLLLFGRGMRQPENRKWRLLGGWGFQTRGKRGKSRFLWNDGGRGLGSAIVFLFSGCLKSLPSGFWDGRMFVVSVAVKILWQRWFQAALWFKEAEYV